MQRTLGILLALMVGSAPLAAGAAGGGGAAKKGPEGIPFSCSDARTLRVVYDGGGMRAKVKLMFASGETHELKAAPTPIGRRYTKSTGDGRLMVWKTNGVDAEIAEAVEAASADDPAGQVYKASSGYAALDDRELARCHRARGAEHEKGGHPEEKAAHSEGH